MAWQTSVSMGGSGGSASGGSDAGGSGAGQPQGTEYTLQGEWCWSPSKMGSPSDLHDRVSLQSGSPGVMRFLQTEWHRHERDRNAWQIERAEMKSRIGKLEGDGRTNKRLRESLDKHVRILENALKAERQKAKTAVQLEDKKAETEDSRQAAKSNLKRKQL